LEIPENDKNVTKHGRVFAIKTEYFTVFMCELLAGFPIIIILPG
jgi:hypothetical protein